MAETSQKRGLTAFSKVMLGLLISFWTLVILPIVVGFVPSVVSLPKEWATTLAKPFNWAIQNPLPTVLSLLLLISLTYIFYLHSRGSTGEATSAPESPMRPAPPLGPHITRVAPRAVPVSELESRYLRRMVRETERLNLAGIPAGLVAPSVPLDEVFIPLQFFTKRHLSDYPLTKDEFAQYSQLLQKGQLSEEMERALMGSEKRWLEILKKGEKIGIADLWQQLDRDNPAAVIQGYPGMGKSTLMARLTLHMARCGLREADPTMGERLSTATHVPILLVLKDYAIELKKALDASNTLSLLDYLELAIEDLHIAGLFDFLHRCLGQGRCLVMFDGLDEVSGLEERKRVKQEIERFILDFQDAGKAGLHKRSETNFNRFLITSRVAGYDVVAFADYLHFTVAELTSEQIEGFLPRWCRASVRHESAGGGQSKQEREESIDREARQMAQRLSAAVKTHQGVGQLAENPLLLTLLAVMQQNSIELPKQRVELYTVVTRTFLENRNLIKNIKPIPEAQAIQRLGPIAYTMQESGNSFARQRDVKKVLGEIIAREGGTAEEVVQEVENFLLLEQLNSGQYISYQEVALLWTMLFPDQQAQLLLARSILSHYNGSPAPIQRYAQRFIAALSEDLMYLMYLRDLRGSRELRGLRELRDLRSLRYLRALRDLRDLRYLRELRELRDVLLTREIAAGARALVPATDPIQYVDLLAIIMGRMLHIEEAKEMGDAVEREMQQLVSGIYHIVLKVRSEDEVREAALDILRYLPVRSANEVRYVVALVESAGDANLQGACVDALRYASPKDEDAWGVVGVREAGEVLGRRR